MLSFFIFLLLFIVPGFLAVFIIELLSGCHKLKCCRNVVTALIFDLFILIINFIGLFFMKHICTVEELSCSFNRLQFIWKYGILSIIVGIILAIIPGIICRRYHRK